MPSERPQSRGDTAWPCPNGLGRYLKTRRSDVIYIFQNHLGEAWPCPNGLGRYLETYRCLRCIPRPKNNRSLCLGWGSFPTAMGFPTVCDGHGSCAGLSAALGLSAANVSTAMGVSTVPMSTRPWRQRDRRALFVRRLFAVLESCSAFVRLCSFICSSVRLN